MLIQNMTGIEIDFIIIFSLNAIWLLVWLTMDSAVQA